MPAMSRGAASSRKAASRPPTTPSSSIACAIACRRASSRSSIPYRPRRGYAAGHRRYYFIWFARRAIGRCSISAPMRPAAARRRDPAAAHSPRAGARVEGNRRGLAAAPGRRRGGAHRAAAAGSRSSDSRRRASSSAGLALPGRRGHRTRGACRGRVTRRRSMRKASPTRSKRAATYPPRWRATTERPRTSDGKLVALCPLFGRLSRRSV